ncbi:MAG: BON domain-containing protein [Desulfobacteraceae bacterium]|jgi:osmotically-inducible protein OsmY
MSITRGTISRKLKQKRISRFLLGLVVSGSFLGIFFSPVDARESRDRDITLAVQKKLINDQSVSPNLIDVWTDKGIVTLTGSVDNVLAKERATEIAETTKGVQSVVNRIVVKPGERQDGDISWDIRQAILDDPATDLYEIEAEVKDGIVTLTGTVDSWAESRLCEKVVKSVKGVKGIKNEIEVQHKVKRQDWQIEAEIKRRLAWDVWVDDALINVSVKNGRVTLSGKVGSAAEKSRAYGDAWVAGVTYVDYAELSVDSRERDKMRREGWYVSRFDKEIERAVRDALLYDPRIFSFNPEVEVKDGVVTLSGVVDNQKAKKAAEEDAKHTAGVWRVKNYMRVRPKIQPSDVQIARRVWDAFSRDTFVERHDISVSVINGTVHLYGTVDSLSERMAAEDLASRVKGVVEVENRVVVGHTVPDRGEKSDWEIKEDIESELSRDPFVDSDEVRVTVRDGVVTLTGTVYSWTEHAAASANAYQGGALKVRNRLNVRNGPTYYRPK